VILIGFTITKRLNTGIFFYNKAGVNFTIPIDENEYVHLEQELSKGEFNRELSITQILLECKKKADDKNISIKCIKYDDAPEKDDVDATTTASDSFDESWRKARANRNIIVPENDRIELDIRNVDFRCFLPNRICYKPFNNVDPSIWKDIINFFH